MTQQPIKLAAALRWGGLLVIAAVAVARCLIVFAPQVAFMFDPVTDPTPFNGLGPAGSLWVDAAVVSASGAALLGEALARRRIHLCLLALALAPIPVIIWHGRHDQGNLWRGGTWAAAAIAAVAVAHLVRDARLRPIMVASLLAVIAPLLVRGGMQMWREHPRDLETYRQKKEQVLRDRGWEAGSPEALMFERRLKDAAPTAWFVTTNVYGAVMAVSLAGWLGVAAAAAGIARRQRAEEDGAKKGRPHQPAASGHAGAAILAALGAGLGVAATGSKGAIVAASAGAALLGWLGLRALTARADVGRRWRFASWIAPAAVIAALAAVIARGTLLPEGFAHDRSLLFRWHYLVAASKIIAGHWLTGVGPDGFQLAYLAARVPRNPEEVASAHSVFVDWLSMLGISGLAWGVLALTLASRAGAGLARATEEETGSNACASLRPYGWALGAVGIVGVGGPVLVEWSALDSASIAARVLGIAGFIALAVVVVRVLQLGAPWPRARRAVRWSLLVGAAVLLMHSQIEMTFYQPAAVLWCMCVLGLAGGWGLEAAAKEDDSAAGAKPRRIAGFAVGAALAGAGLPMMNRLAIPASDQESEVVSAAAQLVPPADTAAKQSEQREAAARKLEQAYASHRPPNVPLVDEAARQLARASELAPPGPRRTELLARAVTLTDDTAAAHANTASISVAVGLNWRMARASGDPTYWDRAIRWARRATELDPHGLGAWRRLGDVLWDAGRRAEAREAYEQALRCDQNFELDELKRLSERDREAIRRRMGEAHP